MINDEYIKEYFYNPNNILTNKKINNASDEIKEYLLNRFNDSESIKETIKRIQLGIEIRPVCLECGGKVKFKGLTNDLFGKYCSTKCMNSSNARTEQAKQTCLDKYGVEWAIQNKEVHDKSAKTCKEKYGVDCPGKIKEAHRKRVNTNLIKYGFPYNIKKYKETCLAKYNSEYAISSEHCRNKIKETCIERYGVDNVFESDIIKQNIITSCLAKYGTSQYILSEDFITKSKNTCLAKYNSEYAISSEHCRNKIKETCIERYGVDNPMKLECVKQQVYHTKKQNKSFNISKQEEKYYNKLLLKYPDVIRQYRDERYPFNCDFYIPSEDLFIEYQGSWTHGKHPYDKNNPDDVQLAEMWRLSNSKYYNNAYITWTKRDVNKRKIAKENKLNFIEIWE